MKRLRLFVTSLLAGLTLGVSMPGFSASVIEYAVLLSLFSEEVTLSEVSSVSSSALSDNLIILIVKGKVDTVNSQQEGLQLLTSTTPVWLVFPIDLTQADPVAINHCRGYARKALAQPGKFAFAANGPVNVISPIDPIPTVIVYTGALSCFSVKK